MFNRIRIPWKIKDLFWAVVFRLAMLYALVRAVYPLIYPLGVNETVMELTDRLLMVLIVLLIVFILYPGGNWQQLGFGTSKGKKALLWGIIGGIILWLLSELINYFSIRFLLSEGYFSSVISQVHQAADWQQMIVPLLVTGIITPLGEELFYRGLIFQTLRERWGLTAGVLISSLLFGLFHFSLSWQLIVPIMGGMVLALLLHYSKSMTACILAHLILNSGKLILAFLNR